MASMVSSSGYTPKSGLCQWVVQHVQMVGVQTAQAVLHVLDDALGGEVAVHLYAVHHLVQDGGLVPPLQAALGGKHHLVAVDVLHGFAHHFLAVVQPVDGRSVDPLDALLHGGLDGLYRQCIVVIAPPCTAADGPCTHAQKRHGDAAFANVDILHILYPPCQQCSPQWEPSF